MKAAILEHRAARPVTIGSESLVSFTFDDVPTSVLANALPHLDEHGIKGTFYVALEMSSQADEFLREDEIRILAESGHDIGCHTLTHYSLKDGSAQGLYEDALAGKRALESLLEGTDVAHFAYPYGAVAARAKALLQRDFATMRTSTRGINAGRVDLNYLRAENLYSRGAGLELDRIRDRLRSIVEGGGWLILYTHGVSDSPGHYDTAREDFRRTVEIVMDSGAPVLPVSEALALVQPG